MDGGSRLGFYENSLSMLLNGVDFGFSGSFSNKFIDTSGFAKLDSVLSRNTLEPINVKINFYISG